MRRYWLFGGFEFEPRGGMCDLRGTFDTIDQALERAERDDLEHPGRIYVSKFEWWQIFDSQEGIVVDESQSKAANGFPLIGVDFAIVIFP